MKLPDCIYIEKQKGKVVTKLFVKFNSGHSIKIKFSIKSLNLLFFSN